MMIATMMMVIMIIAMTVPIDEGIVFEMIYQKQLMNVKIKTSPDIYTGDVFLQGECYV